MNNAEWLLSLKPGDRVAIATGYRCDDYTIKMVDRVTATQIIIGNARFRMKDGRKCGNESYYSVRITEPTEEIYAEIQKAELMRIISSLSYSIKRDAVEKADTSTVREAINGLKSVVELLKQKEVAK